MRKNYTIIISASAGLLAIVSLIAVIFTSFSLHSRFDQILLTLDELSSLVYLGNIEPSVRFIEVPIEVPVEIPIEVPVEVPVEIPVQIPVEVPVYIRQTAAPETIPAPTPQPVENVIPANLLEAGKSVSIKVSAPAVNDMYGYEFKIHYDKESVNYTGGLKSNIDGLDMIFAKDLEGYILIGATMIGDRPGHSSGHTDVCTLSFTALHEFDISELKIESVNVVKSDSEYIKDVENWTIEATVGG